MIRIKRRRILLSAGILAVLGGAFYLYFFLFRTMGSGPAGPPVFREAFASVWTERPVLLLGFGDSVTAGYGASPGKSYMERLVKNPPDEFSDMAGRSLGKVLPHLTVLNLAVSSSTSLDHAARQIPNIPPQSDKTLGLVAMTTGGNDLIHMYGRTPPAEGAMYGATLEQAKPWIAHFETRLRGMLEAVHRRFPGGCHIFLANIYDPSDGVGSFSPVGLPPWPDGLKILDAYNNIIARCADTYDYVHLVDIHGPFLGHGLYCRQFWRAHYDAADPHYWYFTNLEDPNDRGYDAIRRLMLNAMVPVLADAAPQLTTGIPLGTMSPYRSVGLAVERECVGYGFLGARRTADAAGGGAEVCGGARRASRAGLGAGRPLPG